MSRGVRLQSLCTISRRRGGGRGGCRAPLHRDTHSATAQKADARSLRCCTRARCTRRRSGGLRVVTAAMSFEALKTPKTANPQSPAEAQSALQQQACAQALCTRTQHRRCQLSFCPRRKVWPTGWCHLLQVSRTRPAIFHQAQVCTPVSRPTRGSGNSKLRSVGSAGQPIHAPQGFPPSLRSSRRRSTSSLHPASALAILPNTLAHEITVPCLGSEHACSLLRPRLATGEA